MLSTASAAAQAAGCPPCVLDEEVTLAALEKAGEKEKVLDQAGQAPLSGIKIDRGDRLTRLDQGNRNVHRNGGLARATLFIAKNDDVCGAGLRGSRLHEHSCPSATPYSEQRRKRSSQIRCGED